MRSAPAVPPVTPLGDPIVHGHRARPGPSMSADSPEPPQLKRRWASSRPVETSTSTASAARLTSASPVLVRLERREHVVRDVARIAAARSTDTDAQPQELRCPESLRDRAQAVVPPEPATFACLQSSDLEVDVVVNDEHVLGRDLEEPRRPPRSSGPTRSCTSPASRTPELLVSEPGLADLAGGTST